MTEFDVARMLVDRTAVVPDSEDLLMISMAEAAQIARVSVDAMRSLVFRYSAQLPTVKYGGAKRYLKRGDLMRFLKSRQIS